MSSSRSIAAARARRSNEPAPPVNGSRPVTSIGSQAAFANMPPPPSNIRLARGQAPPPQQQQMYQQQQQMYQQQQQQQMYQQQQQQQMSKQKQPQSLPFTKLSISDAIGLVTLRLGRVEQFIIDYENEEHSSHSNIPDNSKIIDTSVLTSIINRLDSLEKREPNMATDNTEQFARINEDIKISNESIKRLNDELVKTNIAAAKHSEQMLRFEREFVENKDILKSLLIKFDLFVKETSDKFTDYEYAIAEIEKNIQLPEAFDENVESTEIVEAVQDSSTSDDTTEISDQASHETDTSSTSNIMSVDLKNMIKQELANEIN